MLNLDLQYFAEDENEEEKDHESTAEEPENTPKEEKKKVEFSPEQQAEVDRIIRDRLAREKKKREEAEEKARLEAERKQLAEQEQYKELAEKLQKELDGYKNQALETKKDLLLANAGYSEKQVEKYRKYIVGETDEELEQAVKALVEDIPPKPKYVDPSPGNSLNAKPEPKDQTEEGRGRIRDLISRGKIRGMKKHKEEN